MFQVDLQTTLWESIAWIDEVGSYFFPKNFDCHQLETGEYQDPVLKEPHGPHKIEQGFFFLQNNQIPQTISLVIKVLKLFSNLTNQVC